jgi:hypothetical protein
MEDQLLPLFVTGAAVLVGLAVIIGAMMSKRRPPYEHKKGECQCGHQQH